jgi:signal peptidase I
MKKNNQNILTLIFSAIAITIIINSLIVVYKIKGNSMSEYFNEGQYVFCLKKNFLVNFNAGDMIVFDVLTVNGKTQMLIKETIGVPGDTIKEIYQDTCHFILIIGKNKKKKTIPLNKNQSCHTILPDIPTRMVEYNLDNKYFVLGSNYKESVDSRIFGPISKRSLRSKVLFSY